MRWRVWRQAGNSRNGWANWWASTGEGWREGRRRSRYSRSPRSEVVAVGPRLSADHRRNHPRSTFRQAPRRVFVDTMGDVFRTAGVDATLARIGAVMAATPPHTYQPQGRLPDPAPSVILRLPNMC